MMVLPTNAEMFARADREAGPVFVEMIKAHRTTCTICRGVLSAPDPEFPLAGLAPTCKIHVLEQTLRFALVTICMQAEVIERLEKRGS